ncbi:MAG: hypothetical protein GOVbin4685_65 [Prokaryotic dsDNA virus sp.]|jgi:hypothetical protein|nr:MAG: hypothetical protein GOVbin4685_65 [Prokaryotic dsDNA virus sp.]|tara:strand:+ start:3350 stop:3670 length:321 start_codon:yes stop_codon:yes gene_type:complete
MSEDTPERIWADPEGHDFDKVDLGVGNTEYIRADLARAAPTVKPLEWSDYPAGSKCETDSRYNIKFWGPEQLWVNEYTTMRRHETLKEAKTAAQADYERRILSALK